MVVGPEDSGTAEDTGAVATVVGSTALGTLSEGVGPGEEGRELRFIFVVRLFADQRPCIERFNAFEPCLHFHKTPQTYSQRHAPNIPSWISKNINEIKKIISTLSGLFVTSLQTQHKRITGPTTTARSPHRRLILLSSNSHPEELTSTDSTFAVARGELEVVLGKTSPSTRSPRGSIPYGTGAWFPDNHLPLSCVFIISNEIITGARDGSNKYFFTAAFETGHSLPLELRYKHTPLCFHLIRGLFTSRSPCLCGNMS